MHSPVLLSYILAQFCSLLGVVLLSAWFFLNIARLCLVLGIAVVLVFPVWLCVCVSGAENHVTVAVEKVGQSVQQMEQSSCSGTVRHCQCSFSLQQTWPLLLLESSELLLSFCKNSRTE